MSDSNYQRQERLNSFGDTPAEPTTTTKFSEPPIPKNQSNIELTNPIETLEAIEDQTGDIRNWLSYIQDHYEPPSHVDTLILYPCASTKPMCESNTYQALAETLDQYSVEKKRRTHILTVSEPFGLIPYELQQGDFVYDNPGLFRWWCKENDQQWDENAQQMALQILGEHIGGFLKRASENSWYETELACVRHLTAQGNTSIDQTHRQMLETAESVANVDLTWLPTEDVVTTLTDERSAMAWQMKGVSHEVVQTELAKHLDRAFEG